MNTSTLYAPGALTFASRRTYLLALAFIAGNVVLPQICHLVPQGGMILLPIYFFTLIGAFAFGWRVGILTAIASPLINCALFGMPAPAVLPAILTKSVLLAVAAGYASTRTRRPGLLMVAAVVVVYQLFGSLAEWAYTSSFQAAVADFRLGLPGILIQIFGGWLAINCLARIHKD